MFKKKLKQGCALGLALTLTFSGVVLSKVHAANAVKTDEKCMIQVSLKNSSFTELTGSDALPVEVSLYKVADIDIAGNYTALPKYGDVDLAVIDEETTQKEWNTLADVVKEEITKDELAADVTKETENGEAIMDELETGLYLIDVKQAISEEYVYDFTPFLISLPNNYYFSTQEDVWVYDLVGDHAVVPKAKRTERLGSLEINKLLDTYNASIGGATFVFQVEATKTDVDLENTDPNKTRVVYSDVVSMTFDGTGQDSILIEDLPAGSDVVVTEIYSGASYEITTEPEKHIKVVAEEITTVDFENTYDGRLNGGNGVVNSFLYDIENEKWVPIATEDSTP